MVDREAPEVTKIESAEVKTNIVNPLVKEAGLEGHQRRCLTSTGKVLADMRDVFMEHPYMQKYMAETGADKEAAWKTMIKMVEEVPTREDVANLSASDPHPVWEWMGKEKGWPYDLKGDQFVKVLAVDFVQAATGEYKKIFYGRDSSLRPMDGNMFEADNEVNTFLEKHGDLAAQIEKNVKGLRMIGKENRKINNSGSLNEVWDEYLKSSENMDYVETLSLIHI